MRKRKICFVITSKIHYSRSKLILEEIQKNDNMELQVVVGGSAILPAYGDVLSLMKIDGFTCNAKMMMTVEGGNSVAMAKTTGLGIAEFATAFDNLEPDIVLVRADRYEVLAATVAAAYLNISIAHLEGGDLTGNIDESVRHAITKLAHIHFPTNEDSRKRIIQMGENPKHVFNVGCPGLEVLSKNNFEISNELINSLGVGDVIDIEGPYIIVMQHPVTSEVGRNREYIEETLSAVHKLGVSAIWFWPNVDAGTDEISNGMRSFRENKKPQNIRFLKYLPAEKFIALFKKSICLVGNSSAGIKEASYLGIPVVNIGTRQEGRMRAENVIDVGYCRNDIKEAVQKQLRCGRYPTSNLYFKENTGKRIVDILSKIELYTQKRFYSGL